MLLCLDNIAVLIIFAVDQHDVSVISLRFFVKKFEDALRARQSHDDTVELHADLVDGHTETLVESQETCQTADRKARVRIKGEKASHERYDHVVGISHLTIDGADHICKGVCLKSALVEFFIEFIESLYRLFFVAEYFDYFLPCHSLLDKSVQFAEVFLLRHEIPA